MDYRLRELFPKDEECLDAILKNRRVEDVYHYLYPSEDDELNPFDLDNIQAAVNKIIEHLQKDSRIGIIADPDSDGYCSAAIMWNYIKKLVDSAHLSFMVHDGKVHGLADKIDYLIENHPFDLLIIPDAGSYDVQHFHKIPDVDIVVLDHHDQMYDEYMNPIINDAPNAIIVNNQLSQNYANKDLCGAGIVYKFCEAFDATLQIHQAQDFIDLAAVGNIGDVMFQGSRETRYIMTEGLKHINNSCLKALIESQSFSLKDKAIPPYQGLTTIDVAFYIVPLINSVVRVGTQEEKEMLFYAFTEPETLLPSTKRGAAVGEQETALQQAARSCKNIKARQDRQKNKAVDTLLSRIQKNGLQENNVIIVEVNEQDGIPNELTGLLAQNIVSTFNRPAVVARRDSNGILKGSLRSNGNFKALSNCKEFFEQSGYFEMVAGHPNAAGCAINNNVIDDFINYTNTYFKDGDFENCYQVDYVFDAEEPEIKLVGNILGSHNDCFGNGVDEVRVVVKNIPLIHYVLMGEAKNSVKINYHDVSFVRFKDDELAMLVASAEHTHIDVYGRFNINEFNGKTSLQLFVDDYEIHN